MSDNKEAKSTLDWVSTQLKQADKLQWMARYGTANMANATQAEAGEIHLADAQTRVSASERKAQKNEGLVSKSAASAAKIQETLTSLLDPETIAGANLLNLAGAFVTKTAASEAAIAPLRGKADELGRKIAALRQDIAGFTLEALETLPVADDAMAAGQALQQGLDTYGKNL